MSNEHILICNENRAHRVPLTRMFKCSQYRVSVCEKVSQLWEIIRKYDDTNHPVDLIILGSEMCKKEIDKYFSYSGNVFILPPFILISDLENSELVSRVLDAGFYGYFVQISEPEILIEQVRNILSNVRKYKYSDRYVPEKNKSYIDGQNYPEGIQG